MLKNDLLAKKLKEVIEEGDFSGVIHMKDSNDDLIQTASGYANRSEELYNTIKTRFGIASGCKLFTAIAIAQLVEKGLLSFDSRLKDCLDIHFPNFDPEITVHHLLTHSSGIPDYFDEDVMDDFEDLWKEQPMYLLKELVDFLPMFQNKSMIFSPGEKFHYNNAGFIVLGLIVQQKTGQSITAFVEENIFKRCNMSDSGYFSLDRLPKNTAIGYIDEKDGTWRTNGYAIPIIGGADGGAYVTAPDMNKLWDALWSYKLVNQRTIEKLLKSHVNVKEDVYYGYGIWINKEGNEVFKYHVMGYDPGVSFHSALYPENEVKLTIPSNKSTGPFKIMKMIEEEMIR